MRRNWMTLALALVASLGCSGPDVRVDEATAAGHRAEAAKELREARTDRNLYDPDAERLTMVGAGGPAGPDGSAGVLISVNPTVVHLTDAEAHRRHALEHAQAAATLEKFEDAACTGLSPAQRLSCPTLLTDALETLPNGVRLRTGPKRLPDALAHVRCHLAFARAQGYNAEALCPFAVKGVTANAASDQSGVDLTSSDPAAVQALHSLVTAPIRGL